MSRFQGSGSGDYLLAVEHVALRCVVTKQHVVFVPDGRSRAMATKLRSRAHRGGGRANAAGVQGGSERHKAG
jgi:hypothetical protein